ncbi:MAG: hypothetical protein ACK2T6_04185 [Anaerolineae bacterium]
MRRSADGTRVAAVMGDSATGGSVADDYATDGSATDGSVTVQAGDLA